MKELLTKENERNILDRRKELENCNFVKMVLMLVVVVFHCILFWRGDWFKGEPVFASQALKVIADWMGTFHIYGFALVSGYIYSYLKLEKGKYDKFLPFVLNKAQRLLIPYVFVAIIWVIPVTQVFFSYSLKEIVSKYVLATSPSQLWFLVMLFDVFVIFWVLSKFFEKHNVLGTLLALILYGASLFGTSIIPNVFCIWTACRYVVFFLAGFKIRQYGSRILHKIPGVVWLLAHIAIFALWQYTSHMSGSVFKLLNMGLEFAVYMLGAVMAFVVLEKVALRVNWQENKLCKLFNRNSMTIYLFHQQVIYFLIDPLNGVLNPYIHSAVNLVVAMAISLLISAVLRRFKATRILIGEK